MIYTFRPARRDNAHLLIGLAGPTGSGKTYTALLLASGIIAETGGRIAFIDTESGRALQYAPPGEPGFQFDYAQLEAPFAPSRYLEAFEAAEEHAGPGGVVIIDSVSHEHEGPGGVLEMHDTELDRLSHGREGSRERYNFPAWARPKAERRKLINRVLQSRCHVIFCFRAKEKNTIGKDREGRQTIVPMGWQPITGDEWPYEMTVFALLNPERKGVPIIDSFQFGKLPLPLRSLVSTEVAINADTGRKLAKWCGNGTPPPSGEPARPEAKSTAVPAATTAAGKEPEKLTKALAQQIAGAMKSAPNVAALDGIWNRRKDLIMGAPASAQKTLSDIYNNTRLGLEKIEGKPQEQSDGGFGDFIDENEPDEWKQDTGRVEDERQGELV